ncbi:DUF3307 domain-containing protein [Segatella bryantii]|jgi:hypothetical protein|nr:DUF3307 domain-containing protein [Segatella bryantii]MDR4932206.1 hypothetical protein [Segatella bryantii]UKK75002.1 DUF3307 domain-containing protein [Segatella bryantii]
MNILILVKLLVAHAVGDFFLQTDGICEGKILGAFALAVIQGKI